MGYYPEQVKELEDTIAASDCDTVVIATPIDSASRRHPLAEHARAP
jgi:predicted GTPase